MLPEVRLDICGDRFIVVYQITGNEADAKQCAEQICIEQTIEFPAHLVADDDIRAHIFGQIEDFSAIGDDLWQLQVSYAYEVAGDTLPQLLNTIFGNISLRPGVLVKDLQLPASFTSRFKGPRFGREGLRQMCAQPTGALFCSALKPIGLSSQQLADQAYQLAKGGIHFIKDDHGISNQKFSPFKERVLLCVEAVEKANSETGLNCRYVPTINGAATQLFEDALWAKQQGVGGLMLLPGISGFDAMRAIAEDEQLQLPIMGHPALLGSFVASPNSGYAPGMLFGQLMRLAGADMSIYPNFGGRFSFSQEMCQDIVAGTASDMHNIRSIFPAPGGGMNFGNVPAMVKAYGEDVMFLIGGALHQEGATVTENCEKLRRLVEEELASGGH